MNGLEEIGFHRGTACPSIHLVLLHGESVLHNYFDNRTLGDLGIGDGAILTVLRKHLLVVTSQLHSGVVNLWNPYTGLSTFAIHCESQISKIVLLEDGKSILIIKGNYTTALWDVIEGVCLQSFVDTGIDSLALWQSKQHLLVGSCKQSSFLGVWDVDTGKQIRKLSVHEAGISYVAVAPRIGIAFSADLAGVIVGLSLESLNCIRVISSHSAPINMLVINFKETCIYSCSDDQAIRCSCIRNGFSNEEISFLTLKLPSESIDRHYLYISCICLANQEHLLLGGTGFGRAVLWNIEDGGEEQCSYNFLRSSEIHNDVCSVCFTPDDTLAITTSSDLEANVWDIPSLTLMWSFPNQNPGYVAILPFGHYAFALLRSGTVILYSLQEERETQKLHGKDGCGIATYVACT